MTGRGRRLGWALLVGLIVVTAAARIAVARARGIEASYHDTSGEPARLARVARLGGVHLAELAWDGLGIRDRHVRVRFEGWVPVRETGRYAVGCVADDRAEVRVAGVLVASCGLEGEPLANPVDLDRGLHPLAVDYEQETGPLELRLVWERRDGDARSTPLEELDLLATLPGGGPRTAALVLVVARWGGAGGLAIGGLVLAGELARLTAGARRRVLVRTLALGSLTATALVGAEVLLRSRDPGPAPVPPITPDGPRNALGYRDRDHAREAAPGVRRLLCVGDSFTFARGIPFNKAFCQRGGRLIEKAEGFEVETLNVSRDGWSTKSEVTELSRRGMLRYEPDVILLSYVLNDAEDENNASALRELRRPGSDDWLRGSRGLRGYLADRSAVVGALSARIDRTRRYRALVAYYRDLHHPDHRGWQHTRLAFEQLARMAREHDARVLIAIFPLLDFPLDDRYPFGDVHERVADLATSLGFEVEDLRAIYRDRAKAEILLVPGVDAHPSEAGHELAAQALARRIRGLGWLSEERT